MIDQGLCDVKQFLDESLRAVRLADARQWLIVSGNDACDLDSTACAIAYAYFKQKKLGTSCTVIPLCNINRADMILRTEVTYWLKLCGLSWENLVYLDDLLEPNSSFIAKFGTSDSVHFVLVDHHSLTGQLAHTGWTVKEVIDHHHIDKHATEVLRMLDSCEHKHIEPVGSCSSLVAAAIVQDPIGLAFPTALWKMLYGALLIDTVGISPEGERAGRLTELDFRMANRIEDLIGNILFVGSACRETLFSSLENAKYDVRGLSTWDLLRRDTKLARVPEDPSNAIVCSTVSGVDFEALVKLPDFLDAAKRLCDSYMASVLVCITVGFPVSGNSVSAPGERLARRKALVLYSSVSNDAVLDQLGDFLCLPGNALGLQPEPGALRSPHIRIPGTLGNPKVTRKIILPTLVRFLRQQPPASSSGYPDAADGSQPATNARTATGRVNVGGRLTEFTASVERIRQWLLTLPFHERADLVRKCLLAVQGDEKLQATDSWSADRIWSPWKLKQVTEQLSKLVPQELDNAQRQDTIKSRANETVAALPSKPPIDSTRCRRSTLHTSTVMHAIRGPGSSLSSASRRLLFGRTRRVSDESGIRMADAKQNPWWLETEYHPFVAGIPPSWFTKCSLPMIEDTSFRLHRRLSNLPSFRSTGANSSSSADGIASLQPTTAELALLRASFGLVGEPEVDVLASLATRINSPHSTSAVVSGISSGQRTVTSSAPAPSDHRSLSTVDNTGRAPCSGSDNPSEQPG